MSKKIKYLSISLVCLVTVCLSFILLNSIGVTFALSPDDVAYGATQEDLETINEKATETDVVEEIGTIQTYPDHYLDNLVYSDNQYIISGDNPIVKVVPRNNFYQSGFNVVIGREYGFFIKSEHKADNFQIFSVLVFDIKNSNYLVDTKDTISVVVTPIYQYRFAYIRRTTQEVYYEGFTMRIKYESNSDTCIIPFFNEYGTLGQSESYYLKDICFGGVLSNEQHYNVQDDQYDPHNDDGTFIIETDYKYKAHYRRHKTLSENLNVDSILNLIDVGLGIVGIFPGVNDIVGSLGLFVSADKLLYNFTEMIIAATGHDIEEVSVTNGQFTANCLYTTRDGQLSNCIGANGQLGLTKAAALEVQGDDYSGNLWYAVGDSAEAIFRVSNSSLDEEDWYTRLTQDIRLTVVDEDENEYGLNELNGHKVTQNAHEFNINKPVYESLNIGEKKELCLLPNGKNYFTLKAAYSGYYEFVLDNSEKYMLNIPGVFPERTERGFKARLVKNRPYTVTFGSEEGGIAPFRVMPQLANTDATHSATEELFAYYCDSTDVYTISSPQTASVADVFEVMDDGKLISQPVYDNQILMGGKLYFVLMQFSGSTGSCRCNIEKTPNNIKIEMGTQYDLQRHDLKHFYEFDCQFDGNYTVQLEDVSGNVTPAFSLVDEFGNTYLPNEYVENGAKFYGLKEGTKYFVGIQSGECKMSLVYDTTNYVWKQKVNGVWQALPSFEVEQMRGTEQEYSLWIGGVMQTEYHIHAASSQGIWEDSNKVKLPDNFVYGDHISLYAYKNKNINLYYPVALDIKGVVDPAEFAFKVEYVNKLQASWTWPTGVYSAKLYVKKGDDVLASKTFNVNTAKSWDLMHDLWNVNALNAKIQFEYSNGKDTTTCDESVDLHLYYDKEKMHYNIYNALQLSYLRYEKSSRFYFLKNDINLLYPWTPIPVLDSGSILTCENYSINGLTLNVDDSLPAWGFFSTVEGLFGAVTFVNAKITCSATSSNWIAVGVACGVNNGIISAITLSRTSSAYTLNVQKTNSCFGGLVGYNDRTITSSHMIGYEMTGSGEMGGIVGYSKNDSSRNVIDLCTVENCTINYKYIAEARRIGGIVGYELKGSIRESQILSCHMNIINTSEIYDTVAMGYLIGAADNVTFIANSGSGSSFNINAVHTNYRKYLFNGEWQYYGRMDNCRFSDPNGVPIEPDEPETISAGVPIEPDEPETI